MGGPNDHNSWEGNGEGPAVISRRPGTGYVDPNRYTKWDDATEPRQKVKRPIDMMLEDPELKEQKCSKCSFTTRIKDDYERHVREVGGMMECERQRKRCAETEACRECSGKGETAQGTSCESCKGMGRVPKAPVPAGQVNEDAIVAKVAEQVTAAFNDKFGKLLDVVGALSKEVKRSAKEEKRQKRVYRSRGVRPGTAEGGSATTGAVEPSPEPVADPSPEPEKA